SIYDYFEIIFNSVNIHTKTPSLSDKNSGFVNETLSLDSNQYYITRGQYIRFEYLIKKNIYYSSVFDGIFGFKADKTATNIEIEEYVLNSIRNFTVLDLNFKSNFIRDEEERYQITGILITININLFCHN